MRIKNKLPKDWQLTKLSQAGQIISGGTPSTQISEYWNGTINWIAPSDLTGYRNKTIKGGAKSITETGLKKSSARLMPKGSVLFSSRAPIGYVAIAEEELCTNQGFKSIIPNENVDSSYLYYFLKASKQEAEKVASGTTFKEISLRSFADLSFPLPPLRQQEEIVSKIEELFSDIDKGIEDLKLAQQQLKVYRQSVLKWAFEGKLTNEGVVDGELPEGWQRVPLKQLTEKIEKVKRKEVDGTSEIIYLDIGSINNERNKIENFKRYTWNNAPSRAQQYVRVNDILFSTVRTYMKNIAIVDKDIYNNQIASSGFTVLRPNTRLGYKYLFYFSTSDIFLNPLNQLQTGSSYPAVRDSDVLAQSISIPSIEEQKKIVANLENCLSVADKMEENISESLQQAEALRQSILKKAFSGELI